jgi:hypothetical protein
MVRQINNVEDIEWFDMNPPLKDNDLIILKTFPFKLPKEFNELLKISDGGYVDYEFNYYDMYFDQVIEMGIGEIYGICTPSTKMRNKNYDPYSNRYYDQHEFFITDHDIINHYNNPPEFFPKNLVAFGCTGNGDQICFDYRSDPKTDNPPIVYWNHEADIGQDVSFVANNFVEFIRMLKEPEDDEND